MGWFAQIAEDVLWEVDQAEKLIGGKKNKEFVSTLVDLKILANLALYHSRRASAGFSWALFKHSQDINMLDDAIRYEGQAIEAWEGIVEAAGDVYHHNLAMGRASASLAGHWRDELIVLKNGLKELQEQRKNFQPTVSEGKPLIAHVPIRKTAPGEGLIVRATVNGQEPIIHVRLGYSDSSGEFSYTNMEQTEPSLYRAVIPGPEIVESLNYFIEAVDGTGQRATYPRGERAHPIAVIVANDKLPPLVLHSPITSASAGEPLRIVAEVRDLSGVKWVRLRYRSVTQFQDFHALEMLPTDEDGEYQAVVPGEHLDPKWDFMYLIEAMDNSGNGNIYPDLEKETPYIIVRLQRDLPQ